MTRADYDVDVASDIIQSRMARILGTITASLKSNHRFVSPPVHSIPVFSSCSKVPERPLEVGRKSTTDFEDEDLELGWHEPRSQPFQLNQQGEETPAGLRVLKKIVPTGIRLLSPSSTYVTQSAVLQREDLKFLIPHVLLITACGARNGHCVSHCPEGPAVNEVALLRAIFGLFSHYHLLAWLKKLQVIKDTLQYASQNSILSVWIKRALWKSAPIGVFLLGSWAADLCSLWFYVDSHEDVGWSSSSEVLLKALLALLLTYQWLCIGFTLLGLSAVVEFGASAPQVLIKLACEDRLSDEVENYIKIRMRYKSRSSEESGRSRESGAERELRRRSVWKLIYLEHRLMHCIIRKLILVIQNLAAGYISFVSLLGVFLIAAVMLKPAGTFVGADYLLLAEVYLTWLTFLQVAHRLACVNAKLECLPRVLMEADVETFDSITRWVRLQNMMQENTGFHIRGWNVNHDTLLKIFMAFLSVSLLVFNRLTQTLGS